MRVNVYAEELMPGLSDAFQIVEEVAKENEVNRVFTGLRIHLRSTPSLPDKCGSAVTIWFRDDHEIRGVMNRINQKIQAYIAHRPR